MNNSNNQIFTCTGINNAISILESKKYSIENINILENSKAEKDKKLNFILRSHVVNKINKETYKKKIASKKTQGISITFSGELVYDEIPDYSDKNNICLLVLDQVEDPQNFGQIIRTVECAGIDGIIFSKHHSAPLTDTVLEVSQGAFVNMNFYEVTNIRNELKTLKNNNFWTIGLENSIDAKPWYSIEYSGKTVIVVGSEGKGIRKKVLETCDFISTIPMQGKTNSLNVGAATAAIVFERLRQKLEKK